MGLIYSAHALHGDTISVPGMSDGCYNGWLPLFFLLTSVFRHMILNDSVRSWSRSVRNLKPTKHTSVPDHIFH